jgi:mannitol-specific phosphotransferase system IIBC component
MPKMFMPRFFTSLYQGFLTASAHMQVKHSGKSMLTLEAEDGPVLGLLQSHIPCTASQSSRKSFGKLYEHVHVLRYIF